ncbi:MAG TPA: hypothetical protein VEM38_07660 [Burkholderiales bacterium]|nr:hypothetical protein [Burkholderiales bacterium]
MNVDRAAAIVFACGATGSGKSHELKRRIAAAAPDRLIVIDADGEYDGCGYLHDSVADTYRATCYPTFRTRLRTSYRRRIAEQQFDQVCRIVRWHCDPQPGQAPPPRVGPVTLVVDELADFVGSSFRETPDSWQWVIGRGRKHGVTLLAASRRPAEIDKSIFDNASTIRTGRLNNTESQRTVAAALGVKLADVRRLTGHEFIQVDKNTGAISSTLELASLQPASAAAPVTRRRRP